MTWRSIFILLLALLAADSVEAALSGWDSTQLELLEQYSTPLRWHNIEGSPYRVAGAKIRHPFASRLHAVQLRPGESITQVQLAKWLVSEGEEVEKDQEVVEIDSDKASFPLTAEVSGKISLKASEGDTIPVGGVIAVIEAMDRVRRAGCPGSWWVPSRRGGRRLHWRRPRQVLSRQGFPQYPRRRQKAAGTLVPARARR